jgi:hypothetical protein
MAKTRKFSVTMTVEVPDLGEATELVLRDRLLAASFPSCHLATIQDIVPLDLTVAAVMKGGVGEMEIREGDDIISLMEAAGDVMDGVCSHDILGTVLFVGSDGKVYCVTLEAGVGLFNPELLAGEVDEIFDPCDETEVYICIHEAPHTYGYEVVRGNGWSLVRTGAASDKEHKVLVVPTSQVFREFETRNGEVFEGFTWEHPDA